MVAQYIATRPILDLCELSDLRRGASVSRRWWEEAGIDLEGAKKRDTDSATDSDLYSCGEESSGASGVSGAEWSGTEE